MQLQATLAGHFYCDGSILETEWERVFGRTWICAGREERLAEPGRFLTLEVGRESILVVRDREGRLRAYFNVCRHRGARLVTEPEGCLKGAVSCPYHAWTYSLDGRLAGTPHLWEAAGLPKEQFSLRPVAVSTWGGFVFINLEGERAAPLVETLAPLPDRLRRYPLDTLRIGAREEHEVACNWKILVENYLECYHCPGVHPELCDIVPLYRKGIVDAAGSDEIAWFREGATTFTMGGVTRRPFLKGLSDEEKRRYDGESIFPTMLLNVFPDYAQYRILRPLAPDRTRIVTEWLFDPETMQRPDFDPSDAIEFINLIGRQDWEVCELVQKGVGSRSHDHGFYTPQESHSGTFIQWYLKRLERFEAALPVSREVSAGPGRPEAR